MLKNKKFYCNSVIVLRKPDFGFLLKKLFDDFDDFVCSNDVENIRTYFFRFNYYKQKGQLRGLEDSLLKIKQYSFVENIYLTEK